MRVTAHQTMLEHLFRNVLENAIKYSDKNSTVHIKIEPDDRRFTVIITNTGIGMSREEIAQAFHRFWRADKSRTQSGHGLGLSIARQIVKAHWGTVKISSNHRDTTTVKISLPREM